jgi:hypothetical protein
VDSCAVGAYVCVIRHAFARKHHKHNNDRKTCLSPLSSALSIAVLLGRYVSKLSVAINIEDEGSVLRVRVLKLHDVEEAVGEERTRSVT